MKSVIITGSTRGLGFQMAKYFLENGYNVTISGTNIENIAKAEEKLIDYKERLYSVICNVQNREEVLNLWEKSVEKWGKINIWINNAGINQPNKSIYEISERDTLNIINTNLIGTINGCSVAMNGMLEQGEGYIYNMEGFGSNDAVRKGINIYGTSKRAITHFTRALSNEAKNTDVKVCYLSPGMMVTDFITGPVGENKEIKITENTKKIFNILGDKPDVVGKFLVEGMLKNPPNGSKIVWLTNIKVAKRFAKSMFVKRNLFD